MSTIHTTTREDLGLDILAPSSVTTSTEGLSINGSVILTPTVITEGTDGNDIFTADGNAAYAFGFDGDDIISNQGSLANLLGGAGNDRFVIYNYTNLAGFADGAILDFEVGSDYIDLSAFEIDSFNELTIETSDNGAFAEISNLDANLTLNVSAVDQLDYLTPSSFIFNGIIPEQESESETEAPLTEDADVDAVVPTQSIEAFIVPSLASLEAAEGGDTIIANGELVSLIGSTNGDFIQGSTAAETLFGGDGEDRIVGADGADIVYGGSGAVNPDDVADQIYGGAGDDIIFGNGGDDILIGGAGLNDLGGGSDIIFGGVGDDILIGNGGDDILNGQIGDDTLQGGEGNDVFVFGYESGDDLVADFTNGDALNILAGVNNTNIQTASDVIEATSFVENGAIINLGGGHSISILGVTELVESDISVVADLSFIA